MLHVDDGALADAVNTGLFTGREDTRLAPHQTFAEFLAADWITAREIPLAQLRSLLVDPLDPERKVVPQLRQLAAWLAAMRQDVFDDVARREPDIVLWSDVVQVPVERRAALVAAMLQAATSNTLDLPDAAVGDRLSRLEYDGLADQLISVVSDSALPEHARDLAGYCERMSRRTWPAWLRTLPWMITQPLDFGWRRRASWGRQASTQIACD